MKKRKIEKIIHGSISLYNKKIPLIPSIYCFIGRTLFGCDYRYTSDISPDVQFIHNGLGCVIHPAVKISSGCKIYQNVTLGGNGKIVDGVNINSGGPILKENVTVFAGACILGPITIGENSIVGANAVVLKDVPPNSIAVGVPAEIKQKKSEYSF